MNPLVFAASFLGFCFFMSHCIRHRRIWAAEQAIDDAFSRRRHPSDRQLPRDPDRQPVQCAECPEWFATEDPLRDLIAHYALAHRPAPIDIVDR